MIFNFVIAILATYRLSQFLPYDDGPFFVFKRFREWLIDKSLKSGNELGFWSMAYDWATCPYCQGLYMAILCGILISFPSWYGSLFLIIMALAGGQSMAQRWYDK